MVKIKYMKGYIRQFKSGSKIIGLVFVIIISLSAFEISFVSGFTQPVKGIYFNPEIYNPQGVAYGSAWFKNYHREHVKEQAIQELQAIKQVARLTHITSLVSANDHLDWPVPQEEQIDKIATFINDANNEGLKVILFIGHPCIIPNSAVPSNASMQHVGGHNKGEIVNGRMLFWDVSYCEDNNIELAKNWYRIILEGLERGVLDSEGIAMITLSGNPYLSFATEMNMLYDDYPYLDFAQEYLSEIVPYIHTITNLSISISTHVALWETENDARYAFLDNLLEAVPIGYWDYIDITSFFNHKQSGNYSTDVGEILRRVGESNSRKIMLSDFGYRNTDSSPLVTTQWHFDQISDNKLGGWWIWQYKDGDARPEQVGIRERGYFGTDGGWKENLIALIIKNLDENDPTGWLGAATGCEKIWGWAVDMDTPDDSINIHIYKDGPAIAGTFVTDASANVYRPDVNSYLGVSGNHGFNVSTPESLKDGEPHDIYVYGIDSSGEGESKLLNGVPKRIDCKPLIIVKGGDVSDDGAVNILDLNLVIHDFGLTNIDSQWNDIMDVIPDGEIDIYDVVYVASRFD